MTPGDILPTLFAHFQVWQRYWHCLTSVAYGGIFDEVSDTTMPRRSKFGLQLRTHLDERRLSIRKFSRMLDPQRPDVARRNLARWIGGYNQPSRIHRIAVAEALGLKPETFLSDDDEEPDPVVDLMRAIRRVVRDELSKEKA